MRRARAEAFPTKIPTESLNLSTYIALLSYGYENACDLGPLLDAADAKLALEGRNWLHGEL